MNKLITFGDSITDGAITSQLSERYANRLATVLNATLVNKGVSTYMAVDGSDALMSVSTTADDFATVMFGTNDQAKYGADPAKRGYFIDALRAYVVRLACVPKPITPAYGATFTGSWNNTFAYSSYGALSAGSKVSFTATGDALALGFLRQFGNSGVFSVTIDGVLKGEFSSGGDVRTILGKAFGVASLVFDGLGAGPHNVVIEAKVANSTTNVVFIHWFAELSSAKTKVVVGNIPYAIAYTYGGSADNVSAYNEAIADLVDSLHSCGLDVSLADVCSALLPADMADNVHPNSGGHLKTFNVFLQALGITETYSSVTCYVSDKGKFYIGEGEQRKEIMVI